MGATGTTTVDFGAFPGASDASVAVTGQTAIVAGSLVEAWLRPVATADHSADEHLVESIQVIAYNIVAGTGFTIFARNNSELFGQPMNINPGGLADPHAQGAGTLLYGQWTVAWVWS